MSNRLAPVAIISIALLALFMGGIVGVGSITPTGFLPQEDQGAFFVEIRLPEGASLNRTLDIAKQVEEVARNLHGVRDVVTITATMRSEVPAESVVVASEWKTSAGLNR